MTSRPRASRWAASSCNWQKRLRPDEASAATSASLRPKLCGLAHNRLWMFCSASAQNARAIRSSRQTPSACWPAASTRAA
ncbi:MAG: hypothetical protein AW07_02055 [Candidatus Accumulibacter sp. SK-11]|nr:MAG: hypothetical protein AW07_02055 [Candidatus Accumulibacter sp. SK-11]